jgi:beta-N-acetylhexosaminidase
MSGMDEEEYHFMTTLDDLIGQTLVFGITGTRVTPRDLQLFRDTRAGGLILYRINFESPAQLRRLISDMEEGLGRRLLVTVDHEGGRVVMFDQGVTVFPDNLCLGTAGDPDAAAAQGRIEARELRALGVDVNFAPTVDVLTTAHSPNIGIRSYGRDPAVVARMAAARLTALQRGGVSACAKHFPGLGPATRDPHLDLPRINVNWSTLRRHHLPPFEAALRAGVDMVMSSHPLYPRLDPEPRTPATFSRRLITGLLRREMGFEGVIASDDLEMGALRRVASVGEGAVRAREAGHDMVLVCHQERLQREAHRALTAAYHSGNLSIAELEKSVDRISRLRRTRRSRFGTPPASFAAGRRLALDTARRGVTAIPATDGPLLPPRENPLRVNVVFPRLSALARRIMVEEPLRKETAYLQALAEGLPHSFVISTIPLDPGDSAIHRAQRRARETDATVFFCFDAHAHSGCRRLLRVLRASAKNLIVVLLRNPYDREFLRPGDRAVTAYGWRECQIRACWERVFGP